MKNAGDWNETVAAAIEHTDDTHNTIMDISDETEVKMDRLADALDLSGGGELKGALFESIAEKQAAAPELAKHAAPDEIFNDVVDELWAEANTTDEAEAEAELAAHSPGIQDYEGASPPRPPGSGSDDPRDYGSGVEGDDV